MFTDTVTMRGLEATVVWGFRTVVVCRSWTALRTPQGQWSLRADVQRADPYSLKQQPLKFTVPRVGGFFCWPIVAVTVIDRSLTAQLGPPES